MRRSIDENIERPAHTQNCDYVKKYRTQYSSLFRGTHFQSFPLKKTCINGRVDRASATEPADSGSISSRACQTKIGIYSLFA